MPVLAGMPVRSAEIGVGRAEVKAESESEQLKLPLKESRKHPGRQELPAHLPRVEKIIACSPEQCICGNCGKETGVIGYEQSEQLDVEPAKYFVVVTKREERACKDCEEQGVARAPGPVRIIEKGLASDRVIIDTMVSKYADYVPIYRQSAILKRETGIDLSRATLDSWVMRVGELLRPITAAMGQELLNGTCLQADETTVGVQMHDGRGKNHQAYLWQYSRPRGPAVFDFRMVGSEKGPSGSWATLQASSKATGTALTIMWVENSSFMPRAGRMPGESSLMQSNSIPKIRPRFGSWRRWMSFLPSTPRPAKKA
jgi:transposase